MGVVAHLFPQDGSWRPAAPIDPIDTFDYRVPGFELTIRHWFAATKDSLLDPDFDFAGVWGHTLKAGTRIMQIDPMKSPAFVQNVMAAQYMFLGVKDFVPPGTDLELGREKILLQSGDFLRPFCRMFHALTVAAAGLQLKSKTVDIENLDRVWGERGYQIGVRVRNLNRLKL